MRIPAALPPQRRRVAKRQLLFFVAIVIVFVLLLSLRSIAVFYTDFLWFSNIHFTEVWKGILLDKLGLAIVFDLIFFVLMFANLAVAKKLSPPMPAPHTSNDELIVRFRSITSKFPRLARIIVSAFLAIIVGTPASGQWKNWILYSNSVPFGWSDPQFHKDASFYIFRLPFLSFLVSWSILALLVLLLAAAAASYFDGGIRLQGTGPRVSPAVKAHLSFILALIALVKAVGYYLQRYKLVNASDAYVNGAGYTDIHAVLPALTLLLFISVVSAVILLLNIRRRGWVLPAVAVGLWGLISVILGGVYPAIVQKFVVQPSQISKESPYIQRNITATRFAMGINNVAQQPFDYTSTISGATLATDAPTLAAARLWDPTTPVQTFNKLQDIRSYYQFNGLAVDRYVINGTQTPVIIGVRQINATDLPAQSWINLHLQYTHGYGAVLAPANQATANGNPAFDIQDLPPSSSRGAPTISQPQVYYGTNNPGFVIANTNQPEIDYQTNSGTTVETHYQGTGGVQLSSFVRRAAFALRFGDINTLISGLITPNSRFMFNRDIVQRAEKAAPFLKYGSQPYPVIYNGQIYWIINGYTTTSQFPYAQAANISHINPGSGLNSQFNYFRNSVKVVINAYSGSMKYYVVDQADPIIQVYEKAFPNIFTPVSQAPSGLVAHFKYPFDGFTVQATMYGRYHITNPAGFYNAGDAWTLAQDPGTSPSKTALTQTQSTNSLGLPVISTQVARMQPSYQLLRLPGQTGLSFDLTEPFVPVSTNNQIQTLSGFLAASSDPGSYGKLTAYITPRSMQVDGPALVNAAISASPGISQAISLLDQHGSQVEFGQMLMIPVHKALLYVRPLYVQSSQNPLPELKQVIVVYGTQAA
ncbi:MAG: UPF0182 family protein, partial [Acidimicrobiaceae bacterium]|nr:UPF0182 family protein [Acidimicrobiaceae bacterium]